MFLRSAGRHSRFLTFADGPWRGQIHLDLIKGYRKGAPESLPVAAGSTLVYHLVDEHRRPVDGRRVCLYRLTPAPIGRPLADLDAAFSFCPESEERLISTPV